MKRFESKSRLEEKGIQTDLADIITGLADTQLLPTTDSFSNGSLSLDMGDSIDNIERESEGDQDSVLNTLIKGARRMEQIKRQLIVQRGSIVAALKHVAQARSVQSDDQSSSLSKTGTSFNSERDRALASFHTSLKVCPMCEARFPVDVSSDDFEQHVLQHFSYESDGDTLQYYSSGDGL